MESNNVKADKLAEQGRQMAPLDNPPGYKVLLLINNHVVSTKYAQQNRHAFSSSDIADYYREKKHWIYQEVACSRR